MTLYAITNCWTWKKQTWLLFCCAYGHLWLYWMLHWQQTSIGQNFVMKMNLMESHVLHPNICLSETTFLMRWLAAKYVSYTTNAWQVCINRNMFCVLDVRQWVFNLCQILQIQFNILEEVCTYFDDVNFKHY
jgi:hypothetical protein